MCKVFEQLSDLELLTLCIYGEARGEGLDGMLAVGSVVINRIKAKPYAMLNKGDITKINKGDIKKTILKPKQFSCFNEDDPNYSTLHAIAIDFEDSLKRLCILNHAWWIARGILEGHLRSNVGDANHYHATEVNPSWAKKMRVVRRIGNHLFYVG